MADDTGNVTDTSRRFEIFVPNPKVRFNFGAANKDTSIGPFGYNGASLQSDLHLFIDINKHTLFQSGLNYCGQVGGKWSQFANSEMIMSSSSTVNLSAKKRILIAAGAGQGSVTALDHGGTPSATPYNSLNLHYRVDRLQVGLFEFFHGRRGRNDINARLRPVLLAGGLKDDVTYFDGESEAKEQKQTKAELKGGFVTVGTASLPELYPVSAERAISDYGKDAKDPSDPVLVIDPLATHGIFGKKDDSEKLRFGFSGYLTRFDPYRLLDAGDAKGPAGKGLVGFLNAITKVKRFLDVVERYASLLADNFLTKRVQSAFAAYSGLVSTFSGAYGLVKLQFNSFTDMKPNPSFEDERKSGWGARLSPTASRTDPHAAGTEARTKAKEKTAAISTLRGPWDLRAQRTFTIEWGESSSMLVDLGDTELPASLNVKAADDRAPQLAFDVTAVAGKSVELGHFQTIIAERLGVDSSLLTTAGTQTVRINPDADVVARFLYHRRDADAAELGTFNNAFYRFGQVVSVSIVHADSKMYVSVNGATAQTVTVSSSRMESSGLSEAVRVGFSSVTGISLRRTSKQAFVADTSERGLDATIKVERGDAWLLDALSFYAGQSVRGQGPIDLKAVTADQLAARIPARDNLKVSTSGGQITLTAPFLEDKDPRSRVKARGGITNLLFGEDPKQMEVKPSEVGDAAQDLADFETGMAQLESWNYELAKLPEDTRNLTRPLRGAISGLVGAMSGVEGALEKAVEVVGKPLLGLPEPPETIGLIADDGIVLSTRDRIVGTGGKGVVFVCDGGSGHEDHQKFVTGVESFVNLALKWDPIDAAIKSSLEKDKPPDDAVTSLGFRVVSDSTVDLLGTHSAQVMALGRASLTAASVDGESTTGIGVVRVAGSHASEIAGYRKVVISARNRGDDDKTGGRVEVAGQTIAIGAMNIDGDTKDFIAKGGFGIEPFEVDDFAGAEQLKDEPKARMKKELAKYAWSETLRKGGDDGHPNTKRVFVHAEKQAVIQVGTYLVHVDSDKGVTIGTRTASADPTANELDGKLPRISVTNDRVVLQMGEDEKDSTLELKKDSVILFEGPTKDHDARAQLNLGGGKAQLWGGHGRFEASNDELSLKSPKLALKADGNVQIDAQGTIKIG